MTADFPVFLTVSKSNTDNKICLGSSVSSEHSPEERRVDSAILSLGTMRKIKFFVLIVVIVYFVIGIGLYVLDINARKSYTICGIDVYAGCWQERSIYGFSDESKIFASYTFLWPTIIEIR